MKIMHISDTHFGADLPHVINALLVAFEKLQPDVVVVSGDITQRARARQFQAAKEFFNKMDSVPLVVVPGNHDVPLFNVLQRLFKPLSGFHRYIRPKHEGILRLPECEILYLNSAQWWRHVNGQLNLAHLRRKLADFSNGSRLRVVVFHHPLDCWQKKDEDNLIFQRQKIAEILSAHRVDLVMNGHIHDPLVRTSEARYADLDRPFLISVAGTATSYRTRATASNSFHFIEHVSDQLLVTRFDLVHDREFAAVAKPSQYARRK